jgi:tRNA U34 5-methylaminomethyl-2-thiouridine-forming methyltransferase MnmC
MKKLASVTLEEVERPIRRGVKEMGFSGDEVDELTRKRRS